MAFARLFGVEHLPQGEGFGTLATAFGLAGWNVNPAIAFSTPPSGGNLAFTVNGRTIEMAHRANASAINPGGSLCMTFRSIWGEDVYAAPGTIQRLVFGVRVEVKAPGQNNMGIVYNNNTSVNSYNSNLGDLGYHVKSDGTVQAVSKGAYVANAILPNSFYAEWVFRTVGGVAYGEFFADGILMATYTSTSTLSAIITGGQSMCFGGTPSVGQGTGTARILYQVFSDIYSLYDNGTAGDAYKDRVGAIVVRKLPVLSVDTNNWTLSAGSDKAATLNTRRDNSTGTDNTTTPTLTSNTDESVMTVNIDTSPLNGSPMAVQVSAAAVRPLSTVGNLNIKLTYLGTTVGQKIHSDLASNTVFLDRITKPISALGTDALTKANLANLKVSLGPV